MKKILISLFFMFMFIVVPNFNVGATATVDTQAEIVEPLGGCRDYTYYFYYETTPYWGSNAKCIGSEGKPYVKNATLTFSSDTLNSVYVFTGEDGATYSSTVVSGSTIAVPLFTRLLSGVSWSDNYSKSLFLTTSDYATEDFFVTPPLNPVIKIPVGELTGVMKVTLALVGSVVSLTVLSVAFRKSWSWLQSLLLQS